MSTENYIENKVFSAIKGNCEYQLWLNAKKGQAPFFSIVYLDYENMKKGYVVNFIYNPCRAFLKMESWGGSSIDSCDIVRIMNKYTEMLVSYLS